MVILRLTEDQAFNLRLMLDHELEDMIPPSSYVECVATAREVLSQLLLAAR